VDLPAAGQAADIVGAMSAPVNTATTPGAACAAAVLMALMRACGRSDRLM